ncbi:HET-domain-containing protein [Melanomma pulvis-pyrius CBS 109.77]|uniref:HET-domain-containing protein n=1 Tax=Melanomma pulvis-pyrius CBS 109.77 TaxID=1314802 RepID=A0A6A6XBK2_9PLEO|nr:HET-domain-containing protein [Melanomma pulvis-pyrius CBS 109.77]
MTLCARCSGIDLSSAGIYVLSDVGAMLESAQNQCFGCNFILQVARRNDIDITEKPETRVVLQRLFMKENRVDLYFLEAETLGQVPLRLCSAYGMELSPSADYEGPNTSLLGRTISAHAGDDECIDLARGWLTRCTLNHRFCSLEDNVELPTRLVHIPARDDEPLRLCVTQGLKGRYVTLSYCWGAGSTFETSAETFEERLAGFHANLLPKTLRDAVDITRRMGFEWLWVDQICIQQRDLEDWTRESAAMATVYGNSVFTICADNGGTTDEGFLKPRVDILRSHNFGVYEEQCLQTLEEPWGSMTWQPLYSRGWAFQERVLSSRNLHFLEDQIAWECNTTLYREPFRSRETNPPMHFAKNMFTKYLHRATTGDMDETGSREKKLATVGLMGAWNGLAQEVAVRFFTVESDKLPAMSGMASAMEAQASGIGQYFAGVWEYNPFLSMAWYCRWSQLTPPVYRGPSWSWVWTHGQLMWHARTWHEDISAEEFDEWKAWDARYGPRLISANMLLKGSNPKGDVLDGSYLTIKGFCRDIYVLEQPHTEYNEWVFCSNDDVPNDEGTKVHMDKREKNWESISSFDEDLADLNEGITTAEVPKFLCVQIVRERKPEDWFPKTLGLILHRVEGVEEGWRRVGLLAFDGVAEGEEDAWIARTLKLF